MDLFRRQQAAERIAQKVSTDYKRCEGALTGVKPRLSGVKVPQKFYFTLSGYIDEAYPRQHKTEFVGYDGEGSSVELSGISLLMFVID